MKKVLTGILSFLITFAVLAAPANVLTDAVTDANYMHEYDWFRWDTSNDYDTLATTAGDTIGGANKYFAPITGWEYYLVSGPASSAGQDSFALALSTQAYDKDKRALTPWTIVDTIKTADTNGTNILLPWGVTQVGTFYRVRLVGVSGAGANDTAIINQRNISIGRRCAVVREAPGSLR